MQTGEGKTLVATMPAYWNAIIGDGVHIHTFNDYLARRDAQWMGPIYEFLGLSVGHIQEEQSRDERRKIYKNDIVYLTAKEGGFDYLREFLVTDETEFVRRKASFAIIDEVDSILIDEARIPLVIAGSENNNQSQDVYEISEKIKQLQRDVEFKTDEYELNIYLTDAGTKKVETVLKCKDLYAVENQELITIVNLALQAEHLLNRDVDYIVRDGVIELVDEFTGRVMDDRKWPHGLQFAIEAKEFLEIQKEGKIRGKTTLRHFFSSYHKICGMTGTALASAEEFLDFYGLEITVIPSNKPLQRVDRADKIFFSKEQKWSAVVEEIMQQHKNGRPVLVGTTSVLESEILGKRLHNIGIDCEVLNARNDEEEAGIIAQAGKFGAVTISTNMAGRGTDIKLGGENEEKKDAILRLGGLFVIGTNRFESKRIDDQLRGRAGRQGDPGASHFFVSLEDDLMIKHGIDELIPKRYLKSKEINGINSKIVRREVNMVQRIIEGKNFEIRATLHKYAALIEIQRRLIHQRRQKVLSGEFDSLLKQKDIKSFDTLIARFGESLVSDIERQVTLAVIDRSWSDYLEVVDQIRQGIHLVVLGGLNPLLEFQKMVDERFGSLVNQIDTEVIHRIQVAEITEDGIDLYKEGLQHPTSTWTYLVNDNPFGDRLEMILGSTANLGFATFAGIYWYLLALYFIARRIFKKSTDQ